MDITENKVLYNDRLYAAATTRATPFFSFDKQSVRKSFARFEKCFLGASIYYAMKANSEPEVLKTLLAIDSGFEVASVNELAILKSLGVSPTRIVHGSAVKATCHIREFVAYGVDRFAFDSMQELEKLASSAPGSRVYARAKVDDTGSVFSFSEKHGARPDEIGSLLMRAKELGLKPYGISFHVGSQALDVTAWSRALRSIRPAFDELSEKGIKLETVNIGGGFPCDYMNDTPTLESIAGNVLDELTMFSDPPQLTLEPGRALVAHSGVLVASIIARTVRGGTTWIYLDVGVYNGLFEAMTCQGSTRYPAAAIDHNYASEHILYTLAGPTGDGLDVIARNVSLPSTLEVGDRIVLHKVGAYSIAMSCNFNGFHRPDVYFSD